MKNLSQSAQKILPSATVVIDKLAKQKIANGESIINLGAGEPDLAPPSEAIEAVQNHLNSQSHKYGNVTGIQELREAVAQKIKQSHGIDYSMEQILITNGAKQSVYLSLLALLNPEDEVIIPSPYWVTYPDLVRLMGAKPVIVNTSPGDNFHLTADKLKQSISAKTKAVILNSPTNPTGSVYSKEEIEALGEVIHEHDLFCISDEIYESYVYDGKTHFSPLQIPFMVERSYLINGVSKSHCMMGWRIGYLAAPQNHIKTLSSLLGQISHHPSTLSQWAAWGALQANPGYQQKLKDIFWSRKNLVMEELKSIPVIKAIKPEGAFYVFFSIENLLKSPKIRKEITDSANFCTFLLQNYGLVFVPGGAFGQEGWVRMSYAKDEKTLKKGLALLKKAISELGLK